MRHNYEKARSVTINPCLDKAFKMIVLKNKNMEWFRMIYKCKTHMNNHIGK